MRFEAFKEEIAIKSEITEVLIKQEIIEEPEIGLETIEDNLNCDKNEWYETDAPIEPKKKKKRKVPKVKVEGINSSVFIFILCYKKKT